jgi:nucleoside-diphosphate-sugar epimerase
MTTWHAFVTGATGFTGGALCRRLLAAGHPVTALVRPTADGTALERLGVRIARGDLRDPQAVQQGMIGTEVVFHIGAAWRAINLTDQEYFDVNVTGTRNVVEGAARAGVRRVVHCSSIGVHGDTGRNAANENSPFAPPDYYCRTKLEGELLAREAFERFRLEGVVFRPLGIYGPGDTRFLKLFRALRRNRFMMIGDGSTLYHMTYIEDLCDGILLCAEKSEAAGQVFMLGGERHTTLKDLVAAVAHAVGSTGPRLRVPIGPVMALARLCEKICLPLGVEPPLYPRRVEFFNKNRAADISNARRTLGYSPQVSLEEGARLTARWYQAKDLL